ncbi:hypothetical protein AAG906_011029 [Vitis piasezkii]
MDLENSIYGYLHERGEIVPKEDKQIQYKGGQQKGMYIGQRMSYAEFVSKACEWLDINSSGYTFHYTLDHNSTEETHNSVASCQANNESNLGLSQGFMSRCAETEVMPHDLSLCPQPIIGSGHSFPNADEFRNALYTMSLVGRFQYKFKKNSPKRISVCCLVDGCPWRITANSVGTTKILKVNIFIDVHNHCADVECSSQPSMRGRRGARVIEQVIRATPQYLPCQICKDFRSRGSLFSATAYDADDGMFPITFGVKLKGILQDKEVVIISDRHQAILRSVSQLFGVENHAYCYRHVKENFSSYVTKHSMKGKKCKMDALLLLDNVAYARLDDDYVVAMEKLKTYNSDLAKWVEENSPQHWAMSKFAKKRWDKMTTNLAESFNAWLKEERHYTIFNLVMTHMDKFAHLACDHMGSTENWKAAIGPKTEEKLLENIIKSGSLPVYPYVGGVFKVFNMKVYVDVNLRERTCTCKAWQMVGIPFDIFWTLQFNSKSQYFKRLIFCSRCQVAGHN